jgi:hypothetical protein
MLFYQKGVRVRVGNRLEFVYKTVTILQKFQRREKSHLGEKCTDAPDLYRRTDAHNNIYEKQRLARIDVMKSGLQRHVPRRS